MNRIAVTSIVAALALSADALAILNFTSVPSATGLGAFTGSMTWTYLGGGTGSLGITMTNTSPGTSGYLTGIAFNTVSGVTLSLSSGRAGFIGMTNVQASPFDTFDFGTALGGNWLGGGSPNAGIGVGVTDSFVFGVSGDSSLLASLTDSSFFDTASLPGFAARFRGFAGGGSDKVGGTPTPPNVVPLPQTLALACGGLVGLALLRRRK
jgi:MYXO-CTERM domain-containing protein